MFHTWQSSSTGLIPVSLLQRFGYTGNVNLNINILANLLMGFWSLISQASRKASGTQGLRNTGSMKHFSLKFLEFSNSSSVKTSEGFVFAFYIVSVGYNLLSALIKS